MWVFENKELLRIYENSYNWDIPVHVIAPDGTCDHEPGELLVVVWKSQEWLDKVARMTDAVIFALGEEGENGEFLPISGKDQSLLKMRFVETPTSIRRVEDERIILQALDTQGAMSVDELAQATRLGPNRVQELLDSLVKEGKVCKFKAGNTVFYEPNED